jgi:mono/diheme cytochrome c family protein
MSFRELLFWGNAALISAIVVFFGYRYLSLRRNPEAKTPSNLTKFFSDDDLEGPRLERVLGWSLIFVAASVLALLVYYVVEPVREVAAKDQFQEESIARGATLFANSQSVHYDATKSLLCANCHGADAKGGSAPFVLQPEPDKCIVEQNKNNVAVPECLPKQVSWQAPDLTLAALRYDPAELAQIITYGRPGTPMPAWGVLSGKGVLNEQGINDLVNYLESVKTTAAKAQADAATSVTKYKQDATDLVATKQAALKAAQDDLAKGKANSTTTAAQLTSLQQALTTAQSELSSATAEAADAAHLSDGAILFRLNCARCHTKGWSYHVTQPARTDLPTLSAQGSGAYGPNLTNGDTLGQFPGTAGVQQQFDWVAIGVPANDQYGARGISSGRMPHFGQVLTEAQIKAIVAYERSL